jgi:hypothetical protein
MCLYSFPKSVDCLSPEAGYTYYLPTLGFPSFDQKRGTAGFGRTPNLMDEHPNNLSGAKCMRQGSRKLLKRMDSFGEH